MLSGVQQCERVGSTIMWQSVTLYVSEPNIVSILTE